MAGDRSRVLIFSLLATVALGAAGILGARQGAQAQSGGRLTNTDLRAILDAGEAQAQKENSLLRRPQGTKTRMHIAICDRFGQLLAIRSMTDAWEGSIDIAIAKARTAALFSSNANALSSRDIGILSQAHFKGTDPAAADEAGPLWGIWNTNQFPLERLTGARNGLVTFPGGVALYKSNVLVGGVGVSGDGVDQDEAVAIAASRAGQATGFEAPAAIRSTAAVPELPYTRATLAP
jgi:uncharacterized protein GlcG (DUF336 family)